MWGPDERKERTAALLGLYTGLKAERGKWSPIVTEEERCTGSVDFSDVK